MTREEMREEAVEKVWRFHRKYDIDPARSDLEQLFDAGYNAAHSWRKIEGPESLPEGNVPVDVTVQNIHDAYEPPTSEHWIERGLLFKGDHWLLTDDGYSRQNVRYELDEIIAWRVPQTPYNEQEGNYVVANEKGK